MSEYDIPFPIQEKIIKRLPVKSLIRVRCVSKAWKSLIDSSQFIIDYSSDNSHTRPHHVLVVKRVPDDELHLVSYIDDDTFPQKASWPTVPFSIKQLSSVYVIGSSEGLICVHWHDRALKKPMVIIWNPAIRRSVSVPLFAPFPENPFPGTVGFGVCPATGDPKLLLMFSRVHADRVGATAAVYKMSSRGWTTLSATLPVLGAGHWCNTITTKKFIYGCPGFESIQYFDLSQETFGVLDLPSDVAYYVPGDTKYASNICGSLALFRSREKVSSVWLLQDDDASFEYLYKIDVVPNIDRILGFRKDRKPIVLRTIRKDPVNEFDCYKVGVDPSPFLVDYDPFSHHTSVIIPELLTYDVKVLSYMETTLLLDCNWAVPDRFSKPQGNRQREMVC